ncbi:MAG TPA: cell wall metabolism sensor histidine kinase WalK [Bacillales bacterium]|nr:cell wall metabolism sensor histidine kinase WalK [Bacillales bacterium]
MQKVGFFRSIHFKIALVYVLLLLVAMQLIGVYFIGRLERELITNFTESIDSRAQGLAYRAAEQMREAALGNETELKKGIDQLLEDADDLVEVEVISANNSIVLGTTGNPRIEGKRTTETLIKNVLLKAQTRNKIVRDSNENRRLYLLGKPIKSPEGDLLGAIYVKASMESIYGQMQLIIHTFETGIVISLAVTAILGVFLSRTITRPVSDMRRHALQIAHGDFSRNVKVYGNDEIGQLATAFNQMTTRLKNANETTEAERKKLKSVLSHMTDGVIATDRNGNVILMNDRAEELLNVYRQNVFGMPILSLLKMEESLKWSDLDESVQSSLIDLSDNEKKHILRANFSMIQRENNPFNGVIVVLHDVTEQEQIEEERREFVSNVSHELRTPLTTMKSYLEALDDGALKDENLGPRFLATAQNETERMIRLVNDLLKLSRMDSKNALIDFSRVDFVEFFHQIIDRFEMTKNENIRFVRELPKKKIHTRIDQDKMTQVLDNIISNALKYSPDGGTVVFRLRVLKHHMYVTVTDEGVGIPKSKISKIFDRFYRVDKARSRQLGGTGLGLAITREMVHAHGGEVWAESEWNEGTSIHLTLPITGVKEGATS